MAQVVRTVRCPDNAVSATTRTFDRPITIRGCGYVFEAHGIDTDPDGWADCPNCGLGFDPDHPTNQPQPERA